MRQPVNQIHAYRVHARFARRGEDVLQQVERVGAPHRGLYGCVQVSDVELDVAKSQAAQQLQLGVGRTSRAGVQRHRGIRREREVVLDDIHQAHQLRLGQVVGCTATEMQLGQRPGSPGQLGDQFYLPLQMVEVAIDGAGVVVDRGDAVTAQATRGAERKMDIDGGVTLGGHVSEFKHLPVLLGRKTVASGMGQRMPPEVAPGGSRN